LILKSGKILSELGVRVKLWNAAACSNFFVDKATVLLSRFITYITVIKGEPHE
jgi:hypothetical protein